MVTARERCMIMNSTMEQAHCYREAGYGEASSYGFIDDPIDLTHHLIT